MNEPREPELIERLSTLIRQQIETNQNLSQIAQGVWLIAGLVVVALVVATVSGLLAN